MWSRHIAIALAAVVVAMSLSPRGAAETMVYTTGAPSLDAGASSIANPLYQAIAESFSVAAPTKLTSATVALWVYQGSPPPNPHSTPVSLTWVIGTEPRTSNIGTGSATLTNSLYGTNNGGIWDIYNSTFSFSPNVELSSGTTYWLSLTDGVSTDSSHAPQWGIVDGSSMSPTSIQVGGFEYWPLSYTLYGVPEPASLAILASVILGAGMIFIRKQRSL